MSAAVHTEDPKSINLKFSINVYSLPSDEMFEFVVTTLVKVIETKTAALENRICVFIICIYVYKCFMSPKSSCKQYDTRTAYAHSPLSRLNKI